MVKSPRSSYLLGVATLWPIVYFVCFLGVTVVLVLQTYPSGPEAGTPGWFIPLAFAHVFTILELLALLAVYVIDAFRNPALLEQPNERTMWVLLLVLFGIFSMPVYWWRFLRPSSESFRRRMLT